MALEHRDFDMTDLKPCPFCGSTKLELAEVADPGYLSVDCLGCLAEGPKTYIEDHPPGTDVDTLAVAAWNERSQLSEKDSAASQIQPPWTPQQIDGLNHWQRAGYVHEFTCPNRQRDNHGDAPLPLVATVNGWVCPYCDYTQRWAHDFMANGPPPNPLLKMFPPKPD